MSDANRATLLSIAEATWGATPATPNMTFVRMTGESLTHAKATVISDEIRPDRQVADLVKVGASASGEVKTELNFTDFQAFIAAALFGEIATLAFAASADINHTTGVVTAAPGSFTNAIVGASYRVAGSATTANNGIKRVIAKAANGSTLTFAASSFTASTTGESLTIGGKAVANGTTKKSFTLERQLPKSDGTGSIFQVFTGMTVDTMGLTLESMKIATLAFGFTGSISAVGDATIASATTAASGDSPMNGTNNVGTIYIDSTAATTKFKTFALNAKNNLRPQDALGQEGAFDLGVGRFETTGTLSAYFEDKTLIEAMINHTDKSLLFSVTDPAGTKRMTINIPRVKLAKADAQAGAVNTDVMLALDWTAIADTTTTGKTIIFSFTE